MYKSVTLTSVYVGDIGVPVEIVSTNEPNKNHIFNLIGDIINKFNLSGEITKGTYKDLGHGSKGYEYFSADTKILVVVKRVQVMEFEKNSNGYYYAEIAL
ncbi:hypothetical protein [Paenibacillus odorifer]|uniref:hypothetical protein n=1 Tax=Paenibacillus odorifer TaxID=189426 RepID=UPI00096EE81D|nr:hypothetical protein [Paenibacillus odorifer]OME41439.1 hypothetical protein BSK58_15015 [Paenibacillus odorifer]